MEGGEWGPNQRGRRRGGGVRGGRVGGVYIRTYIAKAAVGQTPPGTFSCHFILFHSLS